MKKGNTGGVPNPFPDYYMGHVIHDLFFKNVKNGFFIEAGAANGYAGSVCYVFEDAFDWTGVNIEANKYWYDDLLKKRPNCTNIHAALWDKKGKQTLVLPQHDPLFRLPGGASIVMWDDERLEREGFEHSQKLDINTITYHDMCKKHFIERVDLFVLDVEGAEIHVLKGIREDDPLPTIFYIEVDKVDELELASQMGRLGYTAVCENDANRIYKHGKWEKEKLVETINDDEATNISGMYLQER